MNAKTFTDNLANPAVLIPAIYQERKTNYSWDKYKEYFPELHAIADKKKRKDKTIWVPHPTLLGPDGNALLVPEDVERNRIALPLQRILTARATAFTSAGKVTLKASAKEEEKTLYDAIVDAWEVNKLQYKNSEIVKGMFSQTESCEIWYSEVDEETKEKVLKCDVYLPADGYDLIPVYDDRHRFLAFGLGYKNVFNGKETLHFDLYLKDKVILHVQNQGEQWSVADTQPHSFGKIPVIFYNLEESIWEIVQPIIERLEYLISNFGETNDYNGSPILFAEGKILGFSRKGETGKVIEGEQGAKLSYVSWDHAPEAIELEGKMLTEFIYSLTQTPNISFDQMKGLGDISGVAFEQIMIDAHLKAKEMQNGKYGEGIQRRLNFLRTAIPKVYKDIPAAPKMTIAAEFALFKIDDEKSRIENAMKANGGLPITDHLASIVQGGLSDDPQKTLDTILAAAKEKFDREQAAKKIIVPGQ